MGEAVVAFEIANAVLEKFGGDSVDETRGNLERYLEGLAVIVYLVGMPGAGKSVVGRELAGRLGVPFVDLDGEIERSQGKSVPDLFAEIGEAGFRALEAEALTVASTHDPSVVACGGGVVLEPANRITLRNTGTAVFLDVPLDQLRTRVDSRRGPSARSVPPVTSRTSCASASRSTGSSRRTWWTAAERPEDVAEAIVEELRWSA